MKTKIISLLVLSLLLLSAFAKEKVTLQEETPPLEKPDETFTVPSEDESESHVFEVEESTETETETEEESKPTPPTNKTNVNLCSQKSEVYYLTSSTGKDYGEAGIKPEKANEILGAVIFDNVPTYMTIVQNTDYVDPMAMQGSLYGWFDGCMYGISEKCMAGDALSFVTKKGSFDLSSAEILKGKTADGTDYTFYKTEADVYSQVYESSHRFTLYCGFVAVSEDKMAAMVFSDNGVKITDDDGNETDLWEEAFKPMLDSARIYSADDDSALEYTIEVGKYDSDDAPVYDASVTLPDTWEMDYTIASDIPRLLDSRYATKRFEIYRGFDVSSDGMNTTNKGIGTTAQSYDYTWYTSRGVSEGEKTLGVTWYYIFVNVPHTENKLFMTFLVYDDDEPNYYENYCLPVLDSLTIEKAS